MLQHDYGSGNMQVNNATFGDIDGDGMIDAIVTIHRKNPYYQGRKIIIFHNKNGKLVDVPRKYASIISGIDRGMSKFNPRGVMFGHRKYHKLKPNDEYSGSIILKNPLSKKDIDVVTKHLKSAGSSLGFKFDKITFNPDRNEPFFEFRVNNASIK